MHRAVQKCFSKLPTSGMCWQAHPLERCREADDGEHAQHDCTVLCADLLHTSIPEMKVLHCRDQQTKQIVKLSKEYHKNLWIKNRPNICQIMLTAGRMQVGVLHKHTYIHIHTHHCFLPKFSPPSTLSCTSYFPNFLNQSFRMLKIPPEITGVLLKILYMLT